MNITIDTSGPVFDGRAAAAAERGTDAVREALVSQAKDRVTQVFDSKIRVNKGVFIATITSTRVSRTYSWTSGESGKTYTMPIEVADPVHDSIVTTELAMYGPWLEGVGSRNLTTRFRGYFGFREAGQMVDMEAETIADRALQPYVLEMNT